MERAKITAAEFGHAMRMFGFHNISYREKSCLHNNKVTFVELDNLYKNNKLTSEELSICMRYFFDKHNFIPTQKIWESIIVDAGFDYVISDLQGKYWYKYCAIYCCIKNK